MFQLNVFEKFLKKFCKASDSIHYKTRLTPTYQELSMIGNGFHVYATIWHEPIIAKQWALVNFHFKEDGVREIIKQQVESIYDEFSIQGLRADFEFWQNNRIQFTFPVEAVQLT